VEGPDDLGEALFDGHPARVAFDELLGAGVGVVGDDDGGRVATQPGDDELPQGAAVVLQVHGGFVHAGPVVLAGPVQGDRLVVRRGEGVDVADERG